MLKKFYGFGVEKQPNRRERLIFLMGFVFLSAFLCLQLMARLIPGFGEWYGRRVYPVIVGSIGKFVGLLPFSAAEVFLYLMTAACLVYGFSHLRQWKKVLNRAFLLISVLLFVFTMNCGINYYRLPFSQFLNYSSGRYSKEELLALMDLLTDEVNRTGELRNGELADRSEESVKAMKNLGSIYPELDGFYPKPKKLFFSRLLSVQQLAGIYSPFTVEANYNNEMTAYNVPHTMCHELSHLKGFMREDEANFIGFLACIGSENADFQYSGYVNAWIYAGNALAVEDREQYYTYWNRLSKRTREELEENNEFWERFDTEAARVSEVFNDTYLKANSQAEGVKSYGRVVDLLLAWLHR